uniref:SEFIR domain-containing protein n=1 Tax=Macrostomum lignano TaxID=282301 RepID=A0A1I8FIF6_9PLAT
RGLIRRHSKQIKKPIKAESEIRFGSKKTIEIVFRASERTHGNRVATAQRVLKVESGRVGRGGAGDSARRPRLWDRLASAFFNRAFELSHIEEGELGQSLRQSGVNCNKERGVTRVGNGKSLEQGEREVNRAGSGKSLESREREVTRRPAGAQNSMQIQFSAPLASLLRQQSRGEGRAAGEVELQDFKVQKQCTFTKCGGSELPLETHCLVGTDCDASLQPTAAAAAAAAAALETSSAPAADSVLSRSPSNLLQVELRSADRRRRSQQSMSGGSGGGGVQLTLAAPPASSIASDPVILMMDVHQPAHALDPKYLYHAFVCYHASDRQWALGLVKRLEAEPYCYRLCYDMRDFNRTFSRIQNVRVILVLSGQFRDPQLAGARGRPAARLPAAGQRKRKIIPVTLGDALELPDLIKPLTVLSANHRNFFDRLLLTLKHENIVLSDSSTTLWSVMSHSAGSENGHLLVLARGPPHRPVGRQEAEFRHSLEHARHQPSVDLVDSFFSAADLHAMMSCISATVSASTGASPRLPSLAFLALLLLWDFGHPGRAGCYCGKPAKFRASGVFVLPAVMLLVGYFIRWRAYNFHKEELSRRIFMNTVLSKRAALCQQAALHRVHHFHFKEGRQLRRCGGSNALAKLQHIPLCQQLQNLFLMRSNCFQDTNSPNLCLRVRPGSTAKLRACCAVVPNWTPTILAVVVCLSSRTFDD